MVHAACLGQHAGERAQQCWVAMARAIRLAALIPRAAMHQRACLG
jgi:hypothetical protein